MSKRVVGSPEYEAKQLFIEYNEKSPLFDYFFASPPDGKTEEEYLKELKNEFHKLEREKTGKIKEYYKVWDKNNKVIFMTDLKNKLNDFLNENENVLKNYIIDTETAIFLKTTTIIYRDLTQLN